LVGTRRPAANRACRPAPAARVGAPDSHEVAIELRAVPGVGAELVLSVDGELRRARLYRAHDEQAELSGAIANTRATFEAKGWA
jgi:hypothetical protein